MSLIVILSKDYKLLPSGLKKVIDPQPQLIGNSLHRQQRMTNIYFLHRLTKVAFVLISYSEVYTEHGGSCLLGNPQNHTEFGQRPWTRNNPSRVPNSTPGARVTITQESRISVKNTSATSEADFGYLGTEQSNTGQELEARNKGYTISSSHHRIKQPNNDIRSV